MSHGEGYPAVGVGIVDDGQAGDGPKIRDGCCGAVEGCRRRCEGRASVTRGGRSSSKGRKSISNHDDGDDRDGVSGFLPLGQDH